MRWTLLVALPLTTLALSCGRTTASKVADAPEGGAAPSDAAMQALLNQYCVMCHSGPRPKAHVSLDTIAGATAAAARAVNAIESGDMPPKRVAQPSDAEKAQLLAWFAAHSSN